MTVFKIMTKKITMKLPDLPLLIEIHFNLIRRGSRLANFFRRPTCVIKERDSAELPASTKTVNEFYCADLTARTKAFRVRDGQTLMPKQEGKPG